ncbi:MAG: pyridoxal-phosphate dependent enzyme [Oscillospiraceae bacterium]|nr:pyridoxal-phosphate dependent enzyme [Oscillospiraceae bacterium]
MQAAFRCTKCGKTTETSTSDTCCPCGGLWELNFTPPSFSPERIDTGEWSLFRYREYLPFPAESEEWRAVTMGEGMTPVIRLNRDVLLKMDDYMPTLSFKDRGAAVLIAHCKAIGVKEVVQDSSGNAGNSVAAYCARAGIKCRIFVPEGTSPRKISMIAAHGAKVEIVPGSRDRCADVCREMVRESGTYYASHVYNPLFYEGTKTYLYEVYEQLGRIPQNLFIPVGNGTLLLGVMKALEHFLASGILSPSTLPHIFAVQSERCAPLLEAAAKKSPHPAAVIPSTTLAEGIAIGKPMRGEEILSYLYRFGGHIIPVPEEGILPARAELARKGIFCEHTTAATYAAYLKYVGENVRLEDVLIPICGAGLKSEK